MLATLKEEHLKEKEKQRDINALLGAVGDERYALLVRLGKKITDYGVDKHLTAAAEGWPLKCCCFCQSYEEPFDF